MTPQTARCFRRWFRPHGKTNWWLIAALASNVALWFLSVWLLHRGAGLV